MMDQYGNKVETWSVPADLEGICVADPESDLVYLGVEDPDAIMEFNLVTGQVTRTFLLTDAMQGPANQGLEALTFVPDPDCPDGGFFYAGLQFTGEIFVFELPILSSLPSTNVKHVATLTPVAGRSDISGLDFDVETRILYALWDGAGCLRAMDTDCALIDEWLVPGNDQEGIAIQGCRAFVAEDVGAEVWSYAFFGCEGDEDGDGVGDCSDRCPNTPEGWPVSPGGCPLIKGFKSEGVQAGGMADELGAGRGLQMAPAKPPLLR
jgi:hypothetical protein